MKILFLLSRFPYPLTKGDKLRAYFQMKHLSQEHDIFLFCLNQTSEDYYESPFPPHKMGDVKDFCKYIQVRNFIRTDAIFGMIRSLFAKKPLQVGYFTHKRNIRAFKDYVAEVKPDIVFVQFVRMAEYCRNVPVKCVLDFQDCLSMNMLRRSKVCNPALRPLFSREARLLQKYEAAMFDLFALTTIITAADRDSIASERRSEILISANGIDESYFNYEQTSEKKYDIMFCGNMSYAPNADAAEYLVKSIMPLIWSRFPDAKVLIAGAEPSFAVRKLASKNVEISGYVRDMRLCYAQSRVFAAPLRIGSGLQNKLLEAMAIGTPVVCSALANKALQAAESKEILIANEPSQYANQILRLLNEDSLRQNLVSNARTFVLNNYNWTSITQNLSSALQKCVSQR
ncbi:MAG: glycosyltransferase [Bacteroidales bacterium]|jgi:sugar transferase (PEP-CTERM/EpsH1 system associated)|nr:glycosyltransferase [Bacteroidales bacterium]